jgi:CRP/FNR family transcriptional regulator
MLSQESSSITHIKSLTALAGRQQDPACGDHWEVGACASCDRRQHCLPGDVEATEYAALPVAHRRIARGEVLVHAGDPCTTLFTARSGWLKTRMHDSNGRERILDLMRPGDALGLDGFADGHHAADIVALHDSQVCALELSRLFNNSKGSDRLRRRLLRLGGIALRRQQSLMALRVEPSVTRRLALFLLQQSAAAGELGESPLDFRLRLTRVEIADVLGMSAGIVSRDLKAFEQRGWLQFDRQRLRIRDRQQLAAAV